MDQLEIFRSLRQTELEVDREPSMMIQSLKISCGVVQARRWASPLTTTPSELTLAHTHRLRRATASMVTTWWGPQLNALLGSLVVAAGAWLAWDSFSLWEVLLIAGGVTAFLIWQGRTIGLVWAWATLLLGLESLAWPIITMVQIRSITTEPNDEQMGTILSAVLMGLFSAVFWITFSYGFFKRGGQLITPASTDATKTHQPQPQSERPRKNR